MSIETVTCECRGQPYVGAYQVQGEIVRVWFEENETVSPTCGLPAALVARTLLGELVTKRLRGGAIVVPSAQPGPEPDPRHA